MRVGGRVALGVATVAMLGAVGTAAWADTSRCDYITNVPKVISKPGVYCLGRHLSTGIASGAAITIASDDVLLDLSGFTLEGTAGPAGTAFGIEAVGQQNVTVRDGTVRGFQDGISLSGGINNLVERVRAAGNTLRGIGNVGGERNVVRHSQVLDTPGRLADGEPPSALAVGGTGSRALDNDVFGFPGLGSFVGVGIAVGGRGVVVQGNRIGNPSLTPSFGIVADPVPTSVDILIIDNRITTVETGVNAISAVARCRDNFFSGVTVPEVNCPP
jgi:hypothetical protein